MFPVEHSRGQSSREEELFHVKQTKMMTVDKHIKEILDRIPEKPGVYQYFNEEGVIIYVGKAKNLKRRVHSYFNKKHEDSPKTRILVRKIRDIRYTVVESETDALLLENNLIKQYKPRYNILLKDDKTYPSICIKKESFPRVFMTRKTVRDGSEYFGPYSSVPMVYTLLDLIKKIYPLRRCSLAMDENMIKEKKYNVCLYYHLHQCQGPCIGEQSKEAYEKDIAQIREILKGNLKSIESELREKIRAHADKLEFEKAQEYKVKLELIEGFRSKSYVVNSHLDRIDVYSYDENDHAAYINYLNIRQGCIIQAYTFEYRKHIEEEKEDILASGIFEMRKRFHSVNKSIIVPFPPNMQMDGIDFIVPKRGDAKKILDLSERNVRQYKLDILKQQEKLNPDQRASRILQQLKTDLHMKELPMHIECFDNSNIQGTHPVASCVVFKKARPSKKDYRHFSIKTVIGANDFASMEEILHRRYSRLLKEDQELPQLVIVDGGKGQLSSAVKSMRNLTDNEDFKEYNREERKAFQEKIDKIQLIGIAKKLEEIYFPGDSIPLYLNKDSESLKLIQQLRDEAHRFGITFHRKLRSKSQIHSQLDDIKNIGPVTKKKLLSTFKSTQKIKEASLEEIMQVAGKSRANIIYKFFHTENES